jgi:L-fucose isomerase-like protein
VFEFDVAASSLHEASLVEGITSGYAAVLEEAGGLRSSDAASLVTLVGTGGTEQRLVEGWLSAGARSPKVLVAHPGHNSLAAALEALARIHQLGGRGAIVFLEGTSDLPGLVTLGERVADLGVWRRLSASRIGLIGDPSDWLVASMPEPAVVRRVWGPEVVEVPISELIATHVPDREAPVPAKGRPADEIAAASGVTRSLRELAETHRLDSLTVRCFDLIGALETTGCLALSALNDDGMVAGCEGDVVSALGMVWVQAISRQIPWMANPARVSVPEGILVLAHCTVPSRMVGHLRLDTHFESGIGVGLAGEFLRGPVTLLRIGGSELERIWLAEGEVVASGDERELCRTQATVRIGAESAAALLESPLGNHVVMARGHHEAALRRYHDWLVRPRG